ncbi:EamA family transporter [Halorhodospira halophila]|uniref:EamA family transporter n=1 Tax=Halorhodospira halophila TaxID=1053 RepID=UPI001911D776
MAGVFSVSLWGSLPLLRQLTDLPAMMTTVVALMAAAAVAWCSAILVREPHGRMPDPDLSYWLGGVLSLVAALYLYFAALAWGEPARVTLVTYLWPVVFVLVANWLAGRGVQPRVLVGMVVAFVGVAPLILGDAPAGAPAGAETPLVAYVFGVISGCAWAAFSVYLTQAGSIPFRGYARMFAQATLIAVVLQLLLGESVSAPQGTDWLAAALIGVGPYGIAFMTWGLALRKGPTGLLGVLTYMVPVISAVLLVLTGFTEPEPALLIAGLAVVGGALLAQSAEGQSESGAAERDPDAVEEASARRAMDRASPENMRE